ncbi:hypothetical protein OXYTRIMIC_230 [Oxytricha trifallax]|uniref:Uncharacterized protein n=1 Tax=Oxytricha trifallax TaxID=1172189 RepID=A0A073HZH0_9SPIT|nr:hypothetical protein OXYTRIMIC_230 [Oxytricha trifallax]
MIHFCNAHKMFVNTTHMSNCNLINRTGDLTRFTKIIGDIDQLILTVRPEQKYLVNMIWLDERIRGLRPKVISRKSGNYPEQHKSREKKSRQMGKLRINCEIQIEYSEWETDMM